MGCKGNRLIQFYGVHCVLLMIQKTIKVKIIIEKNDISELYSI